MSRPIHVGIAELAVSNNQDDILVAPNLGSCIAVAAYDASRQVGGIIHCLLPLSKADPTKAERNPVMYVDTGFTLLMSKLFALGTKANHLKLFVAGGSQINDENGVFNIGKRNYTVLRKILWKNNLLITAEDVGGGISRTLSMHMSTGKVYLKTGGTEIELK